jgi:hypothetical protein
MSNRLPRAIATGIGRCIIGDADPTDPNAYRAYAFIDMVRIDGHAACITSHDAVSLEEAIGCGLIQIAFGRWVSRVQR